MRIFKDMALGMPLRSLRNLCVFALRGAKSQIVNGPTVRYESIANRKSQIVNVPTVRYKSIANRKSQIINKKAAFTLLEVLVASVLMGMLVTILTMIFNQSAIAWRTGKAGVADLSDAERKISRIHSLADNVLPYTGGDNYSVVSPWDDAQTDSSQQFNNRGVRKTATLRTGVASIGGMYYNDNAGKGNWSQSGLGNPNMNGGRAFVVGVRSAGPDREWDTEDDISTWPDEVD